MTLINKKKVKEMVREHKKQASAEFMEQLDYKVRQLILRAITNARHFTRLKGTELL
jgi:hypothetical protein